VLTRDHTAALLESIVEGLYVGQLLSVAGVKALLVENGFCGCGGAGIEAQAG
jgi:hypothetical protein